MVFGFDISLQWSIYCQTMWRESNWTEIVPNRGTIWQNISLQSSNVHKSIDYCIWCCWFQSGTTNGYYFLTIVHLVERYKIDFGIEWSKCVSYQQGCPKVWKSRGQGWRRMGEAHAPPPQILEDQKTVVVVPARRITTRHPRFSDLAPSLAEGAYTPLPSRFLNSSRVSYFFVNSWIVFFARKTDGRRSVQEVCEQSPS